MQLGDNIRRIARAMIKRSLGERPSFQLRGLIRTPVVYSQADLGLRLNIVIPAISGAKAFGGISTALRFFHTLSVHFPRARVVVVDEQQSEFEPDRWKGWLAGEDSTCDKTVVFLKDIQALRVESDDLFIATYWTTADFVLRFFQNAPADFCLSRRLTYLVQDFEPGFYQWSSYYLLALSTYQWPDTVAVLNTGLLRDFFDRQGIVFRNSFVFEPKLNASLLQQKDRVAREKKERAVLVYGRPGTPRNAFELIVEGLLLWSSRYSNSRSWRVISVGQDHEDIPLANGLVVRSQGKLSLAEYADLLTISSVGLSLMVSPHPSYPPLEMAEFGLRVVTNQFENKDLGERLPNIKSLKTVTPLTICVALEQSCSEHETSGPPSVAPNAFLGGEVEFPFIDRLAALLSSP